MSERNAKITRAVVSTLLALQRPGGGVLRRVARSSIEGASKWVKSHVRVEFRPVESWTDDAFIEGDDLRGISRPDAMENVRRIGREKPMGYAMLYEIPSRVAFVEAMRERGLDGFVKEAVLFGSRSGAVLYFYDPRALGVLLAEHREALTAHGMPITPRAFAEYVASRTDSREVPWRIIAQAFGDPRGQASARES